MKPDPLAVNEPVALVASLWAISEMLREAAPETSLNLAQGAADLESGSMSDYSLLKLNDFIQHYKGLRDIVVSGTSDAEWLAAVEEVRRISKKAVRLRGLDRSLPGRLHRLISPHLSPNT